MSKRDTAQYKITDPTEQLVTKQPPIDRHPGTFLRDVLLPEYGLTNVAELSRLLGVNRPNLVSVLAGSTAVSRPLAYKLGALLNDQVADFLIRYQHLYDLEQERGEREGYKQTIQRREPPALPAA